MTAWSRRVRKAAPHYRGQSTPRHWLCNLCWDMWTYVAASHRLLAMAQKRAMDMPSLGVAKYFPAFYQPICELGRTEGQCGAVVTAST